VREGPGAVPVAIFSRKVQKLTCLDLLVQSSKRGRNQQGEARESEPDTGPMVGGQGSVGAERRGRNPSETWEAGRAASPSACLTRLPPESGW